MKKKSENKTKKDKNSNVKPNPPKNKSLNNFLDSIPKLGELREKIKPR